MMEAARQNGVKKFVYASSSSVYGDHPVLPKKEGQEGKVLSPYALTKKVDEEYGRLYKALYGLDTYGMRYFNVFGRRQDPNGMYAAVILLVYFAQVTTVSLQTLTEQASVLLDYSRSGLFFYYDLLGYGVMALSTFFAGLTVWDKPWLRRLLMLHGLFFLPCFLLPMLGAFPVTDGRTSMAGVIALECWCAFFVPVDVLAAGYLGREEGA